jgi:hypothetical protein
VFGADADEDTEVSAEALLRAGDAERGCDSFELEFEQEFPG